MKKIRNDCPECQGIGDVTCIECYGSSLEENCWDCGNTGSSGCRNCGGSGQITPKLIFAPPKCEECFKKIATLVSYPKWDGTDKPTHCDTCMFPCNDEECCNNYYWNTSMIGLGYVDFQQLVEWFENEA